MAEHVMLDLETFGTGNKAVIVSIGAVKFALDGTGVHNSFHVGVDPESCVRHGLEMDASTVMWWLDNGRDDARRALLDMDRLDLPTALEGFSMWFGPDSLPVWGSGASFDNVLLRSAYKATGQDCPWKFWDDRCYRTVKNLLPQVGLLRTGTHHSALDDALDQTRHLLKLLSVMGLPK